ncbi:MAG: carboxylesterase family protein [Acidobacteria bacterium]|nr:MAG: carboxylesterase family protein [Acidobacteriota bacterium]
MPDPGLTLRAAGLALLLPALGAAAQGSPSLPGPETPADGSAPVAGLRAVGETVVTPSGAYRGQSLGDVLVFRGIRYAAPPVGPLRWRPPEPLPPHAGEEAATAFGPPCLQLDDDGRFFGSEDCLFLNVWAPAGPALSPGRPVLFFVHGGGNVQGEGSKLIYDGRHLARSQGVVVVTVNYRLAALGTLAHPFLDRESERGVSGNYGLLDLLAALRWVRENGPAFGADPERLLLFGESAGAVNTCALLSSPLARGLFSAALMQSGGCHQPSLDDVEAFGETIVQAAGCASTDLDGVRACMRALSAEAVLSAVPAVVSVASSSGQLYGPAVDGWVLPASPYEALREGTHNHVPFAVGANADETSRSVPPIPTEAAYEAAVFAQFGLLAPLVLREYPASAFESPQKAFVAVTTDARFVCPSRRIARAAARSQSEPVFRYYFTHTLDSSAASAYGAFHGLELPFVFGTIDVPGFVPSAAERDLSRAMGHAWASLARWGRPEVPGAEWPRYDPATDPYARFGNGVGTGEGVRTERCDFWDRLAGEP